MGMGRLATFRCTCGNKVTMDVGSAVANDFAKKLPCGKCGQTGNMFFFS